MIRKTEKVPFSQERLLSLFSYIPLKKLIFFNNIVLFTLLELLICISIIAILASLLLPALKATQDTAKRIKCAGNEKQIGAALMFYVSDSNEYMPCCGASPYYWYDQIWTAGQYLPDPRLYSYDEVSKANARKGWTVYQCPSGKSCRCDYALNYYLGFQIHHKFGFLSKNDTSTLKVLDSPSEVAWLSEGNTWFWRSMSNQPMNFNHNNKANILHLDQHVDMKSYNYIEETMTKRLPWGIWW